MKSVLINRKVFGYLVYLLDRYKDSNMPPTDYLEHINARVLIDVEYYESVAEIFLALLYHKRLLSDFIDYFYCLGKRKNHSDKNSLMVISHFLISVLNNNNMNDVISILQEERCQKVVNFLQYLNKQTVIEKLFLASCQYFEEQYVQEKIILNIKQNKDLLKEIQNFFEDLLMDKNAEHKREVTRPVTPRLSFLDRRSSPPPPANTPQEVEVVGPRPAPLTTYVEPKINEVLMDLKEKHRKESKLLLENANKAVQNLTAPRNKHICPEQTEQPSSYQKRKNKHHKINFQKTDIPVKKNAATILREAARLIKEEEKEIKRMNDLVGGAANYLKYEELLDQLRAHDEEAKLEDIERKHLHGLLTREEAILAKQKLLETNRAKRLEIEQERKETEEMLKQIKQKQEEEIRQLIEKTQQIQKNIEEKKKDVIVKNHIHAQELTNTNRQLLEEAMMRQRQELERRIEIIKEIKALSAIKDLQTNKFDPTETMNIGLLCEMSLAELYERLLLKRTHIKEEIENRQKCIRKQKLKQQQFLAETEQFIEICRQERKAINEQKESTLQQHIKLAKKENKDIKELREKLEKARKMRMEFMKS